MLKSQHSQQHNVTDIAIKAVMAIAFAVSIQGSVLASTSQIARNEATLSRFSTCAAANKAGFKSLRTRVGFTPRSAKRSFDADRDGISCEAR
ncbi:hypothetical protein NIES4071_105830 (plasmid) [Calothrix sp. NIES-4071]|nr:hypothetical protein NIES4071_105830 [Calothrix sp. NIES-4071]BAZ65001.1 hypothetical protein NIES4105_107340 [Calothrix sp. NIES-4105]